MNIINLIIITALMLGGCNMQEKEENPSITYQTITAHEANERLLQNDNIILLDVRTKEEYSQIHIPNSILIPVEVLKNEAEDKLKDKDSEILIYCRSGRRSIIAAEILVELGYTNVYDIGGIIDWQYETATNY